MMWQNGFQGHGHPEIRALRCHTVVDHGGKCRWHLHQFERSPGAWWTRDLKDRFDAPMGATYVATSTTRNNPRRQRSGLAHYLRRRHPRTERYPGHMCSFIGWPPIADKREDAVDAVSGGLLTIKLYTGSLFERRGIRRSLQGKLDRRQFNADDGFYSCVLHR